MRFGIPPSGAAAQAQDYLCRQADRYTKLAERVRKTLTNQPTPVPEPMPQQSHGINIGKIILIIFVLIFFGGGSIFRMLMGYGYIGSVWTGVLQATQNSAGAPLAINANGGNVGIGTSTPGGSLDVMNTTGNGGSGGSGG